MLLDGGSMRAAAIGGDGGAAGSNRIRKPARFDGERSGRQQRQQRWWSSSKTAATARSFTCTAATRTHQFDSTR